MGWIARRILLYVMDTVIVTNILHVTRTLHELDIQLNCISQERVRFRVRDREVPAEPC